MLASKRFRKVEFTVANESVIPDICDAIIGHKQCYVAHVFNGYLMTGMMRRIVSMDIYHDIYGMTELNQYLPQAVPVKNKQSSRTLLSED
jgi:hypothetical protein